jgi:micrococcal nuclease
MAKFHGRLWLARDRSSELTADFHVEGDRIRIVSGDDVIGEWDRSDVDIQPYEDGVHLLAEGEELVLRADDIGFEAALVGRVAPEAGLASRIRAAGSRGAHATTAPRPWWQRWWAITGAAVLALVFVSNLADNTPTTDAGLGETPSDFISGASPSSTQRPTSESSSPSFTLPRIPHADILFAPPALGPSGDPFAPLPPNAEVVAVVSITDADTLNVAYRDGITEPLRLIGINSPESRECWSDEATLALAALAPVGSQVGVTVDVSDRDQFDRLLRYLWVGGMSVNEELVRRGAAISRRYPPDTAMSARFEAAQADAQQAGIGLWAPDACGPAADADLRIVTIEYDPPGDDNENLNSEWIVIRNFGTKAVALSGWGIKDESASNRYAFPTGFSLSPLESVIVYSGCGDDFGTDLFWCSIGSAIWNNDGDSAFLVDPNGNTHTSHTYAPTETTSATIASTPPAGDSSSGAGGGNCDPSYPTVCIVPPPPDLNCSDVPYRRFDVVGPDPHGFDGDNDGIGCES